MSHSNECSGFQAFGNFHEKSKAGIFPVRCWRKTHSEREKHFRKRVTVFRNINSISVARVAPRFTVHASLAAVHSESQNLTVRHPLGHSRREWDSTLSTMVFLLPPKVAIPAVISVRRRMVKALSKLCPPPCESSRNFLNFLPLLIDISSLTHLELQILCNFLNRTQILHILAWQLSDCGFCHCAVLTNPQSLSC